jgi:Asp/Glu/hydantoin racemase
LALVKYYLIVFDRGNHRIVELEEFAQSEEAVHARFKREIEHSERGYEVVVLGATSMEALVNTHSRYFGTGRELSSA